MTFTLDRIMTPEEFYKEFGFVPTMAKYKLWEIPYIPRHKPRME